MPFRLVMKQSSIRLAQQGSMDSISPFPCPEGTRLTKILVNQNMGKFVTLADGPLSDGIRMLFIMTFCVVLGRIHSMLIR